MQTPSREPDEDQTNTSKNTENRNASTSSAGSAKESQPVASTPEPAGSPADGHQPHKCRQPSNSRRKRKAQRRNRSQSLPLPLYTSRDLIHLKGGLGDFDERVVEINSVCLPSLGLRKFLVLLILVCHSLTLSGVKPPVKVATERFLTAKMILEAIVDYLGNLMPRPGVFLEADPSHVTDMVYEIRLLLKDSGINRNLIQNGPRRYGYRLGTPPHNVQLSFILPGTQQVIHLRGLRLR